MSAKALKSPAATAMRSENNWGDRLQPPFQAVGDHIGCELPGGRAMFFTRRGGVSAEPFHTLNVGRYTADYEPAVDENRKRVATLLGIPQERWLEPRQAHGSTVERILELPEEGAEAPEADGIATTLEDVAAVVTTADCLPVALFSSEGVAMLHAGWRGLAADILAEGVEAMRELGGEDVEIHAAIGPGIGVCCYEVDAGVHRAFERYGRGTARLGDHAHLKSIARLQLQDAKVPPANIHDAGICTMCAPRSLFHSHRRDGAENTGRQASAVRRTSEPGGHWPS